MTLFTSPNGTTRTTRIQELNKRTANGSLRDTTRLDLKLSTFEEERREALASVLVSLAIDAPDPDRTAACHYLLRHLTQVAAHR
jgi:hypothetical protein